MSKDYTIANAANDALDLALGAVGMAISLSKQHAIPVQRRLEVLNGELQEIQKDINHFERQRISGSFEKKVKPMPVDVANVLTNMPTIERSMVAQAMIGSTGKLRTLPGLYRDACESLVLKGVFAPAAIHGDYVITEKYRDHV